MFFSQPMQKVMMLEVMPWTQHSTNWIHKQSTVVECHENCTNINISKHTCSQLSLTFISGEKSSHLHMASAVTMKQFMHCKGVNICWIKADIHGDTIGLSTKFKDVSVKPTYPTSPFTHTLGTNHGELFYSQVTSHIYWL